MSTRKGNRLQRITSMSRIRFEELRQGILDGSLAKKWTGKAESDLNRSERAELRQLNALQIIAHECPDVLTKLYRETKWRSLEILKDESTDLVSLRVK